MELRTAYDSPVDLSNENAWKEEALSLGNGFIGAMVFGGSSGASAEENHAHLQAARAELQEKWSSGGAVAASVPISRLEILWSMI